MLPVDSSIKLEPTVVYTDGAISKVTLAHPVGGWGFLIDQAQPVGIMGAATDCTSNQMEMWAVFKALSFLLHRSKMSYTRCLYCLNVGSEKGLKCGDTSNPPKCKPAHKTVHPFPVQIYSDSQYVVNGFNDGLFFWKTNNWKTKMDTPVLNRPIWEAIDYVSRHFDLTIDWVKGHASTPGNHTADALATTAVASYIKKQGVAKKMPAHKWPCHVFEDTQTYNFSNPAFEVMLGKYASGEESPLSKDFKLDGFTV